MEYRKLKELATISISNVDKKTAENEKTVRLCNFVDVYRNWAITENMIPNFMIASAKENEIEKYALHKGDVCITKDSETKDDIGMSTYIADDIDGLVLGYHCALISPDKSVLDGKYLNAFLQTDFVRKFYELNASGSGQRYTLSLDAIGEIPIPVISLEKQKRKGELLSLIDRKIENNNKINDNLSQQLKLIYDYWFTQYDFPNDLGKPYKSSNGNFVYNSNLKCNIPDGWNVVPLGTLCSFRNGINYDKNAQGDKDYRIINVRNITASTILISENDCDIINLLQKQAEKYILSKDDIIIARSGSPGATRLMLNPSDSVIFCGFIICCSPFNSMLRNYIWCWLKQLEGTAATKTGGSILQNVSQDTLKDLPIILPPEHIIDAFNHNMDKLILHICNNMEETQQLAATRNWLLPMLMSGQATIAD